MSDTRASMQGRTIPRDQVRTAGDGDDDHCIALIVLAFAGDPAARWLYPNPQHFLDYFPRFARAFGGKAFGQGTAHLIEGSAAALWFPPGFEAEEESLMALIEESVPAGKQPELVAVLEQMGSYHPHEPHWYLPLIGTDPAQQSRGFGSALLAHALARCDADGLPAYLEATSARNVPFYRRHGFEPLGTIQEGSGPPITPMLRPAR